MTFILLPFNHLRYIRLLLLGLLVIPSEISAQSPTDEELRALEKQIEEEEIKQTEIKKKTAEQTKRKGEENARIQQEQEKQSIAEDERIQAEKMQNFMWKSCIEGVLDAYLQIEATTRSLKSNSNPGVSSAHTQAYMAGLQAMIPMTRRCPQDFRTSFQMFTNAAETATQSDNNEVKKAFMESWREMLLVAEPYGVKIDEFQSFTVGNW